MDQFWIEAVGYAGTGLCIMSYSMRTIVPLRVLGILSSVCFMAYGVLLEAWPLVITDAILLPLNTIRLIQIRQLMKQVTEATENGDLSLSWLRPFAQMRRCRVGDIVFRAGDKAEHMMTIESGRYRLVESGIELGAGEIVGELGFLSPDNRRMMSLECIEEGLLGRVSYSDLRQLYFQNPKFGFAFLRLIGARLFKNISDAQTGKTHAFVMSMLDDEAVARPAR